MRPLTLAAATFVLTAAGLAGLVATAAPASADWETLPGTVTLDCVVPGPNDTYRAVFGYDNVTRSTGTIPVGRHNALTPRNLNGHQITTFSPGSHRTAFATPPVANSIAVTWTLGERISATATASSPVCDESVTLQAESSGSRPVFILAGSLLLIGTLLGFRGARRPVRQVAS